MIVAGAFYSVSGNGVSLAAPEVFAAERLTIKAGKRKTKVVVRPSSYAPYSVGNGKKLKLTLEAGRGYAVEGKGGVTIRFDPAGF